MDELDELKKLAGIGNRANLSEYTGTSTMSTPIKTAQEKIEYQTTNNIRPGTNEWFRLWFSRPDLTGEQPW